MLPYINITVMREYYLTVLCSVCSDRTGVALPNDGSARVVFPLRLVEDILPPGLQAQREGHVGD